MARCAQKHEKYHINKSSFWFMIFAATFIVNEGCCTCNGIYLHYESHKIEGLTQRNK